MYQIIDTTICNTYIACAINWKYNTAFVIFLDLFPSLKSKTSQSMNEI